MTGGFSSTDVEVVITLFTPTEIEESHTTTHIINHKNSAVVQDVEEKYEEEVCMCMGQSKLKSHKHSILSPVVRLLRASARIVTSFLRRQQKTDHDSKMILPNDSHYHHLSSK